MFKIVLNIQKMPDEEKQKTRKKKQGMKNQPVTVNEWLDAKLKYPAIYTVSPNGVLVSPPSKPGESETLIMLEPRVVAPKEYISNEFLKRSEEIKIAEEQFTESRRALHRAVQAYRQGLTTAAEVVIANQQTKEMESYLIEKTVAPRSIITLADPTPEVRDVILDNPYLKNKMADPVYVVKRNTFPWTNFYSLPISEVVPPTVAVVPAVPSEPVADAKTEEQLALEKQQRTGAIIGTRKKKIKFGF